MYDKKVVWKKYLLLWRKILLVVVVLAMSIYLICFWWVSTWSEYWKSLTISSMSLLDQWQFMYQLNLIVIAMTCIIICLGHFLRNIIKNNFTGREG